MTPARRGVQKPWMFFAGIGFLLVSVKLLSSSTGAGEGTRWIEDTSGKTYPVIRSVPVVTPQPGKPNWFKRGVRPMDCRQVEPELVHNAVEAFGDQMTKDDSEALSRLLAVFTHVMAENNITWMLVAGSTVGALRHHEGIAWDDDLDAAMEWDTMKTLHLNQGVVDGLKKFGYTINHDDRKNHARTRVWDPSRPAIKSKLEWTWPFLDVFGWKVPEEPSWWWPWQTPWKSEDMIQLWCCQVGPQPKKMYFPLSWRPYENDVVVPFPHEGNNVEDGAKWRKVVKGHGWNHKKEKHKIGDNVFIGFEEMEPYMPIAKELVDGSTRIPCPDYVDYTHAVVGHVLGVRPDELAKTYDVTKRQISVAERWECGRRAYTSVSIDYMNPSPKWVECHAFMRFWTSDPDGPDWYERTTAAVSGDCSPSVEESPHELVVLSCVESLEQGMATVLYVKPSSNAHYEPEERWWPDDPDAFGARGLQ